MVLVYTRPECHNQIRIFVFDQITKPVKAFIIFQVRSSIESDANSPILMAVGKKNKQKPETESFGIPH